MADESPVAKLQRRAMLSACIPQQRAAITEPSYLKVFFCPRRSGKSFAIGVYLFLTALMFPGCSCLYLGLTKDTAQKIMNKDVFRVLNDKFKIGAKWKDGKKVWILPNGSHIYLSGADANQYEIRKLVGQKYRLAVLDEASKYRHNVKEMVYGFLLPAMGDDLGTVVLAGTPSNIITGLFFDASTGKEPGWALHHWKWQDNTFARDNVQALIDDILAKNPAFALTPLYRQEWLGEWVVDLDALVYKFQDDRNTIDRLPRPAHEYIYGLGGDLGYVDPTALVVTAYHAKDPCLYIVEAEKRAGQNFRDVANWVKTLWRDPTQGLKGPYPFESMVFDPSNKQGVEELRRVNQIPVEAAKQRGKDGVIAALNAELITGRIKLLPKAMGLVEEWKKLIWDEKKSKAVPQRWEEDPRFPNHLADACLYGWRKARNFDVDPEKPVPLDRNSIEGAKEAMFAEMDRLAKARRRGYPLSVDRVTRPIEPRRVV